MLGKRKILEQKSFGISYNKSKKSRYNSAKSSRSSGGSGVLSHFNSHSRNNNDDDDDNHKEWDNFWQNVENSTYDSSSGADSSIEHSDPYVDDDNDDDDDDGDDDDNVGVPDFGRRIVNESTHFNMHKTILPPKTNKNTRNKQRSRAKQSKNTTKKKQSRKKQSKQPQKSTRYSDGSEKEEVDKDGNEYIDDNECTERSRRCDTNVIIPPEYQEEEEEEEEDLEPKPTFSPNFAEVIRELGELKEGEKCFGCRMGRLHCPASGMSAWNDLTQLYFHTASLCTPAEVCKHLWNYYENNIRIPSQKSDRYSRQLPPWSKRMIYEHFWGHITHPVIVSEQIRMELAQITRNHLKYNVWENVPFSNDIINAITSSSSSVTNFGNQTLRKASREYDITHSSNAVRVRGDAKSVAALNRTVTTFLRVKEPADYAEARQIELKPPKTNNVYLDPRSINYVSNVTKF